MEKIVSTGYGRHTAKERFGGAAVTEITAYGAGASALFPEAASVLDIGGQDTKVIALGVGGRVTDFEMNDKCAAGTGKFLEVMARALGFSLPEMATAALASESGVAISSMCTVFAESEVTGLVHRGEDRARRRQRQAQEASRGGKRDDEPQDVAGHGHAYPFNALSRSASM